MQKQLKITSYIHPKTGEYAEKKNYVDMQFNDDGYLLGKNRKHIKSFQDITFPDEFTWAERGRIEAIRHYILKDNQLLVYRGNAGINPITVKEMCRILEMSDRQCKSFVKKLKQYKVIKEVNIGGISYFCFNPLYGLKDKRINLTIFIIFQDELKDVLPNWVISKFLDQAKDINPNIKVLK